MRALPAQCGKAGVTLRPEVMESLHSKGTEGQPLCCVGYCRSLSHRMAIVQAVCGRKDNGPREPQVLLCIPGSMHLGCTSFPQRHTYLHCSDHSQLRDTCTPRSPSELCKPPSLTSLGVYVPQAGWPMTFGCAWSSSSRLAVSGVPDPGRAGWKTQAGFWPILQP